MREAGPEIGAINVDLANFRQINLFAAGAKCFEARCAESVTQSNRQHLLSVAQGTGTGTEDSPEVLLIHLSKPSWGQDVF